MLSHDVIEGHLAGFLPLFSLVSLSCVSKPFWAALKNHPRLQAWKALFLTRRWICCLSRAIEEGDVEVFRFCERRDVFFDVKDLSLAARAIGRSGNVWALENWPLSITDALCGKMLDEACRHGQIGFLASILKQKRSWNHFFLNRMAHHAACGGHTKLLELILLNAGDRLWALEHAFQGAAEHGHIELAHWCWNHGARGIQDFAMAACRGGKISMVIKALESGAKPMGIWLALSAESGSVAMVDYLIELLQRWEIPFDADSCFCNACLAGDLVLMRRFALLGASCSGSRYKEALENVARSGVLDAFLFVFRRGDGEVELSLALELASSFGHMDIVQWIVENSSVDEEWLFRAAACAHEHGMNDIVEYLLKSFTDTV